MVFSLYHIKQPIYNTLKTSDNRFFFVVAFMWCLFILFYHILLSFFLENANDLYVSFIEKREACLHSSKEAGYNTDKRLMNIPGHRQSNSKSMGASFGPVQGLLFDDQGSRGADRGLCVLEDASVPLLPIIHGTNKAAEVSPLCMDLGVACLASCHQVTKEVAVAVGAQQGRRGHNRISCQTLHAKGHSIIRCCMVSGAWSHRGQVAWFCRPEQGIPLSSNDQGRVGKPMKEFDTQVPSTSIRASR
jgi:hypothetical protein